MSRLPAVQQSDYPYNISARCINREWFSIPMDVVWKIFCRELSETQSRYELKIHSFVLMSNHYHLIASTPRANISQCMQYFMGRVSRSLAREGNRINETFAGRHYKCILQNTTYFLNAYKYNYRNPVMAGICDHVEMYPFSSLQFVMKKSEALIAVEEDLTYECDPKGTLLWLNRASDPEKLEAVRRGHKHTYFKSRKYKNREQLVITENDLI